MAFISPRYEGDRLFHRLRPGRIKPAILKYMSAYQCTSWSKSLSREEIARTEKCGSV
ncbi:hypothetical protein Mapa_011701 [Marchantia paleacea]|nr:hypothetical protein Mapa_011701 [Marchantia paleacea]